MKVISDPRVKEIFDTYPELVQEKLLYLRELVISVATEMKELDTLKETLKWGEPSYITKNGSTLRMNWNKHIPNQYAIYFQCSSRLVDTFRLLFDEIFKFEGKRAIIFQLDEEIPVSELKKCIRATLNYHKVKHLESLGILI